MPRCFFGYFGILGGVFGPPLTSESASVSDVVRMRLGCGSGVVWMWLRRGSDVVRTWVRGGSDVFSDLVQTVWQKLRESGFQRCRQRKMILELPLVRARLRG